MNAYDHNGDQLSVGDYVMCLSNGCELESEIVSILPDNQIEVVPMRRRQQKDNDQRRRRFLAFIIQCVCLKPVENSVEIVKTTR